MRAWRITARVLASRAGTWTSRLTIGMVLVTVAACARTSPPAAIVATPAPSTAATRADTPSSSQTTVTRAEPSPTAAPTVTPSPSPRPTVAPTRTAAGTSKLNAPAYDTAAPTRGLTPTVVPLPTASVAELDAGTPARNLADLAARLEGVAYAPVATVAAAPDHPAGYRDTFNIADQVGKRYFSITATVRVRTAHAYFYVQDGLDYDPTSLQAAAQTFESRIYPTDRAIFGSPRTPGPDGDNRVAIVNANVPGVGGYFSSSDQYPPSVLPYSNDRNAIYVNVQAMPIGSAQYLSTLAHEFQHMIHWNERPHDDSWLNEGMSVLAQQLNGYPVGDVVPIFLGHPDVQLNAWAPDPAHAVPHYGAAYLFIDYFLEHFGGTAAVRELLASRAPDLQVFANYLARHDPGVTLDDLIANWVVANYLDDPSVANGRYAYPGAPYHASADATPLAVGHPLTTNVHQFAARYVPLEVDGTTATLDFHGDTTVPLMAQALPPGAVEWWSNRADTMDTTLTRPVDLRDVRTAHLDFSYWMDVENAYDYCYVEASDDGGRTWQTLPGTHSTVSNPNGQNYGNAYTGTSSASGNGPPIWWNEQVDLTPYAGERILLRFEYVTDEAYSGPGVALRSVRIPEIGFDDGASGHTGWTSSGWLLVNNAVPEHFIVQLILYGKQPTVVRVPLDAANDGTYTITGFGTTYDRAVVVVTATAPKTMEPGGFTLMLDEGVRQ